MWLQLLRNLRIYQLIPLMSWWVLYNLTKQESIEQRRRVNKRHFRWKEKAQKNKKKQQAKQEAAEDFEERMDRADASSFSCSVVIRASGSFSAAPSGCSCECHIQCWNGGRGINQTNLGLRQKHLCKTSFFLPLGTTSIFFLLFLLFFILNKLLLLLQNLELLLEASLVGLDFELSFV